MLKRSVFFKLTQLKCMPSGLPDSLNAALTSAYAGQVLDSLTRENFDVPPSRVCR